MLLRTTTSCVLSSLCLVLLLAATSSYLPQQGEAAAAAAAAQTHRHGGPCRDATVAIADIQAVVSGLTQAAGRAAPPATSDGDQQRSNYARSVVEKILKAAATRSTQDPSSTDQHSPAEPSASFPSTTQQSDEVAALIEDLFHPLHAAIETFCHHDQLQPAPQDVHQEHNGAPPAVLHTSTSSLKKQKRSRRSSEDGENDDAASVAPRRVRRQEDPLSFKCSLSSLPPDADEDTIFDSCSSFTASADNDGALFPQRVGFILVVDQQSMPSEDFLAVLEDRIRSGEFDTVVLTVAIERWDAILGQILIAIDWPADIVTLIINVDATVRDFQLGELPADSFRELPRLNTLSIKHPGLNSLPLEIFDSLTSLRTITISDTELSTLKSGIFSHSLTSLETIILENNPFEDLPPDLFEGVSPTTIKMADSNLQGLPLRAFNNQTNLQTLTLSSTNLRRVTSQMFLNTPNLKTLHISNNELSQLPGNFLSNLPNLQVLEANNNQLSSFPAALLRRATELRTLHWGGNQLSNFPSADIFEGCPHLSDVRFGRNLISEIPRGLFYNNTVLSTVWFHQNRLHHLPRNLFDNHLRLTHLRLQDNRLTSLPEKFFDNTPALSTLDLERNRLASLPGADIFNNLTQLTSLQLDFNQLTALPKNVFNRTTRLTHLDIDNNQLRSIPAGSFDSLSQLTAIDLSFNEGLTVPAALFRNLRSLEELSLYRVTVTGDVDALFENTFQSDRFTTLSIGWDGLDEDKLPLTTVCRLLNSETHIFQISFSSYTSIQVCPGKSIETLLLAENSELTSVETGAHNLLNVSYSPKLTELVASGTTPVADVSGTSLALANRFCVNIGSTLFFARNMLNPLKLQPEKLLQQCFENADAFDFSENEDLFANPVLLESALPKRVILSAETGQLMFLDTDAPVVARPTVPVFVFDDNAITCETDFESTQARLMVSDSISPPPMRVITFTPKCGCSPGFHAQGSRCVSNELTQGQVAGVVVGAAIAISLLTLCIQYVIRWFQRKQRERYILLEENELRERLLSEAKGEVAALKQGWRIDLTEIALITKVDEGAFGAVWKGDWEGIMVAVKFLKHASFGMVDEFMMADIEKEVDFLQRTRHPNLVRFFGTGTDDHGAPFLVLEFVDLGSLKHLLLVKGLDEAIKEARRFNRNSAISVDDTFVEITQGEGNALIMSTAQVDTLSSSVSSSSSLTERTRSPAQLKLCLVRDIVDGMAFLHSLNVLHRDLKSGNVLVNKKLVAKITDFGSMSGKLSKMQQSTTDNVDNADDDDDGDGIGETSVDDTPYSSSNMGKTLGGTMTAGIGTPLYMAPEILDPNNRRLSLKADVFSFGVLMWEIHECRRPDLIEQEIGSSFKGFLLQTLFRLYNEGKRLEFGQEGSQESSAICPKWYEDLAYACMSVNSSDRPTFEEIKEKMKQNVV